MGTLRIYDDQFAIDTAQALRIQLDTDTQYTVNDFAAAVASIGTGYEMAAGKIALTIDENGNPIDILLLNINSAINADYNLNATIPFAVYDKSKIRTIKIVGENYMHFTSTGGYAFSSCTSLTSIDLPKNITSIGESAFYSCTSLTSIDLPKNITSIGGAVFSGCTSLTSIDLPKNITSIGVNAFYNCTSLYFIDLTAFIDPQAIPTLANTNAFQNIPATAQFIVANQEMYDAFTTATNWSTYASKFVIEGA